MAWDESEALEAGRIALEHLQRLLSGDHRAKLEPKTLIDAPASDSTFSIHEDEFISGTPSQVAEQIIEQCRTCGAGHFLCMFGRGLERLAPMNIFGEEIIPELHKANIT